MPTIKIREETAKLRIVAIAAGPPALEPKPGTGTGSGWIYFEDVTVPGGTASQKVFQDPPGNTVLNTVTVSATSFDVTVLASYPRVDVNGVVVTLPRDTGSGFYRGVIGVNVSVSGDIVATVFTSDGDNAATDTLTVNISLPPSMTALSYVGGVGGYPTGPNAVLQTELKEDDGFTITVTADKSFDLVEIQDFGASKFVSVPVTPGVGPTQVQVQVADRGTTPQALAARVRVRDTVTGAFGATRDTDLGGGNSDGVDLVTLNNLFPTVTIGAITYPSSQSALKGSETATVVNTVADFDTVAYADPTGTELSITSPSTFQDPKTVQRVGGTFNDVVLNFLITAVRDANGSTTTQSTVVVIADVAPTIDVTLPAARLRSGGQDGTSPQDHTVTITSSQPLLNAPSLSPDPGGNRGAFTGAFTGGPAVFTAQLRVDETVPDEKGAFTFAALSATGLAGVVQAVINSGAGYTLGGFIQRTLTFPAFSPDATLNTEVVTLAKLQAGIFTATNQPALKQPISTSPPVTDGFTIDAVSINPTTVIWLDTPAVGSNSSGTAAVTAVEETV